MQQMRRYDHDGTGNFEAMREIELVTHRCRAAVHAVTHTPRLSGGARYARAADPPRTPNTQEGGMAKKRSARKSAAPNRSDAQKRRESGEPGGGQGRRDEVGPSGVYPRDADNIPGDAEVRMAGSWGGGDYNESGGSELVYRDGQLLGGLTAGPSGEPTIDIHGGDRPELHRVDLPNRADTDEDEQAK
jgi:hypothetical protein